MTQVKSPGYVGYAAMDNGSSDYEGHHGVIPKLLYWGAHCHDFYEFYIHFHGGQQMTSDGRFIDLVPYQLFVFPPFSMHGLICLTEVENYERAYLYCTNETLRQAGCGQIDLNQVFRTILESKGNVFQMTQEDAEFCRGCIEQIAVNKAESPMTPETSFENYSLITAFLSRILKTMRSGDGAWGNQLLPNPMEQVITYINEHYTEPLQLSQIAARFNISRSTLCHEFVRYTNRGVYDYILYRRIVLARQLILSGHAFGEVSDRCGFADYSNFLRVFRKHVGMSPREYRNSNHAENTSPDNP